MTLHRAAKNAWEKSGGVVMGAQLVLVHGWGFDGDVWNPLRELLGDMATRVHDLGFFGRPAAALPEPGAPVVAVGMAAMAVLWRFSDCLFNQFQADTLQCFRIVFR